MQVCLEAREGQVVYEWCQGNTVHDLLVTLELWQTFGSQFKLFNCIPFLVCSHTKWNEVFR